MEEHFEWVKDVPETATVPQEEYDYLSWFRAYADFGPAHSDVIIHMHKMYTDAGFKIPDGWKDEE